MGALLEKALMPPDGSMTRNWTGFAEPLPDSLLLVGHIKLRARDLQAAKAFYVDGLGATLIAEESDSLRVRAGATEFVVEPTSAEEVHGWPGQLYIWVEDINGAWKECKAVQDKLGTEVVEQAVCNHDERKADVLVLHDPASATMFVVNQAPKGFSKTLHAALGAEGVKPSSDNLLCVVDLLCYIPSGAGRGIASFYKQFFSAAVKATGDGCRVHFAAGEVARQTLTFKEDPALPPVGEDVPDECECQVCIYMPSEAKFQLTFAKCNRAGIVCSPQGGWEAAKEAKEFVVKRCLNQAAGRTEYVLEHLIRSPTHPECLVADCAEPNVLQTAVGA